MKKIALMAAAALVMGGAAADSMQPPLRHRDMEPDPNQPKGHGKTRYRGSRSGVNPEKERLRRETNEKIAQERAHPERINEKYLSAHQRRQRRAAQHKDA